MLAGQMNSRNWSAADHKFIDVVLKHLWQVEEGEEKGNGAGG